MIDLTNAPEGATHTFNGDLFKIKGKLVYIWRGGWYYSPILFNNINLMPLAVVCDWSIYSNTKPLSELSDEKRGLLVNYLFSNGDVQTFNGEVWLDMLSGFNLINREFIYRAKQKTERELFVEAALLATKPFSIDVAIVKAIAEDMFNAGFEAPKVGE